MKRGILFAAAALLAGVGLSALFAQDGGYGGALINAKEKALRLKCQNNLKQIHAALDEYRGKFDGYPSSLDALVEKKILNAALLRCPSANTSAGSIDYKIDPSATDGRPLCCCKQAWHQGGRNVLKADGSVEWVKDK